MRYSGTKKGKIFISFLKLFWGNFKHKYREEITSGPK
jgi:hypothetical protein